NFNQRVSLGRNDLLIRTFPDARQSFLSECDSADPAAIGQIISKYGRVRG
ncbi:TPA: conjugal transfer protein, partial [Klebsiella pneumoniae]|nr:conjugal transfer protein [Klebsiella pneumoniae]